MFVTDVNVNPVALLMPHRKITGISAILLPFTPDHTIDWVSFQTHLIRTVEAGLIPAVNIDTGYVTLLEDAEREAVLLHTREVLGGKSFVAGAFVKDQPGDSWNPGAYQRQIDLIQQAGGIPIILQSYGLTRLNSDQKVAAYRQLGRDCTQFIAFELDPVFAPFGQIYDLDTYQGLLDIPQCIGAKHSSLRRTPEWERLSLRDNYRPDFKVFTGNDLAIDMVMYGSDYLLGISTFAPDLFARRDAMWATGDPDFYELNDKLQYLGNFAFRSPVPAYKHSAAQFLKLRGWLPSDEPHSLAARRPASDIPVLREIAQRLGILEASSVR